MQQFFEPIMIGDVRYSMDELTFAQAIRIARIPEQRNEARLTLFLRSVFANQIDPLTLTTQERYFLLLSYLAQQNALGESSLAARYLKRSETPFKRMSEPEDGLSVHLMGGRFAEILETQCNGLVDWVVGSLAMQVIHADLPSLPSPDPAVDDDGAVVEKFKARCKALGDLPVSKFNALHAAYLRHMDDLSVLVNLTVDPTGFVVRGGGADDAPVRFRPSAAFTGVVGQLERLTYATR